MKALFVSLMFISFSAPTYAKCVVEILASNGDPLGFIFQENECKTAQAKCKSQLARLNRPGATCEITLDIPAR